ncbi:MAG: 23S rRNA (adenine(2503)-C(2))-methyltransferase RlmN, partial [Thermobifida sp.]|nr:23S rRNA (adenine(2503)-C(2))-methyltransferase RlmN [Thermobifida sp.]
AQEAFVKRLQDNGIATSIRDTRGSDIDGACGQLATAVADGKRPVEEAHA